MEGEEQGKKRERRQEDSQEEKVEEGNNERILLIERWFKSAVSKHCKLCIQSVIFLTIPMCIYL